VIAPLDVEYSRILGVDILRYMEARMDLRSSELVVGKTRYPLQGLEAKIGEGASSRQSHLRRVKSATGQATPMTINHREEPCSSPSQGRSREHPDHVWSVTTFESTILPPMSQVLLVAKIRGPRELSFPKEVLIEPQGTGISGTYVPRVVSRVLTQREITASHE
jgi:hypothetical protein